MNRRDRHPRCFADMPFCEMVRIIAEDGLSLYSAPGTLSDDYHAIRWRLRHGTRPTRADAKRLSILEAHRAILESVAEQCNDLAAEAGRLLELADSVAKDDPLEPGPVDMVSGEFQ